MRINCYKIFCPIICICGIFLTTISVAFIMTLFYSIDGDCHNWRFENVYKNPYSCDSAKHFDSCNTTCYCYTNNNYKCIDGYPIRAKNIYFIIMCIMYPVSLLVLMLIGFVCTKYGIN